MKEEPGRKSHVNGNKILGHIFYIWCRNPGDDNRDLPSRDIAGGYRLEQLRTTEANRTADRHGLAQEQEEDHAKGSEHQARSE
ncbi:hypothetical protein MRX96_013505 [Rhipicephalus microplus]